MNQEQKQRIEEQFQNMNLEAVGNLLDDYREMYPYDRDLLSYQTIFHLYKGELDIAFTYAKQGIRRFPTSGEMYYNLASIHEANEDLIEALKNYNIALYLYKYAKFNNEEVLLDIAQRISMLEQTFNDLVDDCIEKKEKDMLLYLHSYSQRLKLSVFGKYEKNTRSDANKLIGTEYWIEDDEKRYIGLYRAAIPEFVGDANMDLIHAQGEFLKTNNGIKYTVVGDSQEYLLPIASSEPMNIHIFEQEGKQYKVLQRYDKHFNYYRVKKYTQVSSSKLSYYGNPIALGHHPKRKKLVLNLFVDGLAQEVIQGDDFEKLMPNTYRFFKEGMRCVNAYSCSEWTYPSLATYMSGLNTLQHMMFHNDIDGELPKEVPTLAQYFKKAGYYTSKIDGDWRSIYSYGYARGVDQYVYQIQHMGSRAEQEIANAIEHLEAFKETDQYLWLTVGDLHDIADGLDLSVAVQNQLSLEERQMEEIGATSVKQSSSENKSNTFRKAVSYMDMLFRQLFDYILRNYEEDEFLLGLFSDHGQGYLIPKGSHFLSKERTKVAMMFRGGVQAGMTEELISTADYLPIMCKLADIPLEDVEIAGQLPVTFGGTKEREYTITESLHPGDPYYVAVNTKDATIYFNNGERTDGEGRFRLKDYKMYAVDQQGNTLEDAELLKKYEAIILERIWPHVIYD